MKNIERKISLDFSIKSKTNISFSNQSDFNSRVFLITLFDDGVLYKPDLTDTAYVNVLRSDGTNSAFSAEITSNGLVKYTAGSWALGVAGITSFSVSIRDSGNRKLTSSPFTIDIAPGLYLGEDVNSNENLPSVFEDMMMEIAGVKLAESERIAAEDKRNNSEIIRIAHEKERTNNEKERIGNEEERMTNENMRVLNEDLRAKITSAIIEGVDNLLSIQNKFISGEV